MTENGKKTRIKGIHRDRRIQCGCLGCPRESGYRQRVFLRGYGPLRLEGIGNPIPENYRNWTFHIESGAPGVVLSVSEDNIPDETKRARSDEFWSGVLSTIKGSLRPGLKAWPQVHWIHETHNNRLQRTVRCAARR